MTDKEKFIAYEKVRLEGKFNMLTKEAQESTGLSLDDYFYVISNYEKLYNKFNDDAQELEKDLIEKLK